MLCGRLGLAFGAALLGAAWGLVSPLRSEAHGSGHPAAATRSELIIPGRSAGPVRLGATKAELRAAALQAQPPQLRAEFAPRKWRAGFERFRECGGEVEQTSWGTPPWSKPGGFWQAGGEVFAYLTDGRVFLVATASPAYRTAGGLTVGSTPEQVERLWPNLRAYEDNATSAALNNRPVIYWVSQKKGIAFALASDGPGMGWTRSVDTIEVFRPTWKFQPHGCAWPGEWSPLPSGTIHLRRAQPKTRIAFGPGEWGPWAPQASGRREPMAITNGQHR